jgi:hypothetical protein
MRTIHLSEALYSRLLRQAQSFEDTPEDVIARLLDAVDDVPSSISRDRVGSRGRAVPGTILPERDYWPTILDVIASQGGRAAATDVIEEVGRRMEGRLLPADFDNLEIGEARWRNRVRFARLRLKENGLLRGDSPRGVWEITDRGREYLRDVDPKPKRGRPESHRHGSQSAVGHGTAQFAQTAD